MKPGTTVLPLAIAAAGFAQSPTSTPSSLPLWAYPVASGTAATVRVEDPTPHHIPGSTQSFTVAQVKDLFRVPDWYPQDHPQMPDPVGVGRRPVVYACG